VFKRVTWFVTGAAAGVGGGLYAKRRVKQAIDRLAPEHVQAAAKAKAQELGDQVVEAVREGRAAMRAREAELRGMSPRRRQAIDTTARASDDRQSAVDHAARGASAQVNPVRRQRAAQ
jgi:hypothetical protein